MKKLVVLLTFVLIFSGFLLIKGVFQGNNWITWIHISLGFGYTVIFILFTIDHISSHRNFLFTLHSKNLSGSLQVLGGGMVLLTGFLLYLYGSEPVSPFSEIHLVTTILLLVGNLWHFRSIRKFLKKRSRR